MILSFSAFGLEFINFCGKNFDQNFRFSTTIHLLIFLDRRDLSQEIRKGF